MHRDKSFYHQQTEHVRRSHQGSDDDACESVWCEAGTCTLMDNWGKDMMRTLGNIGSRGEVIESEISYLMRGGSLF